MPDSYAIIYAPGVNRVQSMDLIRKVQDTAERIGFYPTEIKMLPEPLIEEWWEKRCDKMITLIVGWGLPSEPKWNTILHKVVTANFARNIYAVDLFERKGVDGRILHSPKVNAGEYWSRRTQEKNLRLFLKGYYIKNTIPYGMVRIPVKEHLDGSLIDRKRYILKPGRSAEIEIVRLIFDLFVNHDYNRTEICNLLNAQKVESPNKSDKWSTGKIATILKSPMYVGANQYRECVKWDVFPPIIEKSVFFEAQARVSLFHSYTKILNSSVVIQGDEE